MAKPILPDELWEVVGPLLPPLPPPSPKGGRPPVGNREALTGILFVLKTGIPWEDLPCEMGCGSGMTCWRRLRTGRPTAPGTGSTGSCWPGSAGPTRSMGRGP